MAKDILSVVNKMGTLHDEYRLYSQTFNRVWDYLRKCSEDVGDVASTISKLRGYESPEMHSVLVNAGFIYLDGSKVDVDRLQTASEEFGLFTKKGDFLLDGRFIFPIKDVVGNVLALVGWFPDEKKYITTPSRFFRKDVLYYGMEELNPNVGQNMVVVEGIFDRLSIKSIGYPCIAMMGSSTSKYKTAMYRLFRKVVAIPDLDKIGRKIMNEDSWNIPVGGSYLRLSDGVSKDIDDLIKANGKFRICSEIEYAFASGEREIISKIS